MAEATVLKTLLEDAVNRCQGRAGDAAPEIYWHLDPSLPEELALDDLPLAALFDALLDWSVAGAAVGLAGVGVWRGHEDGGDPAGALVVQGARMPRADAPEAAAAAAETESDPLTQLLSAGGLPTAETQDGQGVERRTVTLPSLVPEGGDDRRRWGLAFERRRLLVLRHPLFSDWRMQRSLGELGLNCDFIAGLDDAVKAIERERVGDRPYDFAVLNAGILGGEVAEAVARLRAADGDDELSILLCGAEDDHRSIAGIDRCVMRAASERLMDVLFETVRRPVVAMDEQRERSEVPDLTGRHLLIVEDVPMNRALLQAMLAPTGATLAVAADGQEALEAVASRVPDLVLLDIQLPVLDGLEVTRRLRADGYTVPLIALTANAREADRATYLNAGMDGYLAKPIKVDDLYAILRHSLGS
ncbi:MAG: response regulator [Pseudomonadota bacterium]